MKFRPFTRFRNSSIRTKYLWAVASLVTVLTLCGMHLHYHTSRTLYKSYIDNAEADSNKTKPNKTKNQAPSFLQI